MKIAVTSTGPGMDSAVDERFGRARYILIVDPETEEFESVDNAANVEALQGAGVQAAQEVVGADITTKILPRRPGDTARLVAGSDRLREELGWTPKYDNLRDIIATAWQWHKNHPNGYK